MGTEKAEQQTFFLKAQWSIPNANSLERDRQAGKKNIYKQK